jgi:hypothetical protein
MKPCIEIPPKEIGRHFDPAAREAAVRRREAPNTPPAKQRRRSHVLGSAQAATMLQAIVGRGFQPTGVAVRERARIGAKQLDAIPTRRCSKHCNFVYFNYKMGAILSVVAWFNEKAVDEYYRCAKEGCGTIREMDVGRFTEHAADSSTAFLGSLKDSPSELA